MSSYEHEHFTMKLSKNNAKTHKMNYFSHKCQNYHLKIMTNISIFGFIYQPFQLKLSTKSRSLNTENNAQKLHKQLLSPNNIEKLQKMTSQIFDRQF